MAFFALSQAYAQSFRIVSSSPKEMIVEAEFNEQIWQTKEVNGEVYFDFSNLKTALTSEKGAPALPLYHTTIQLPNTGNPTVEVVGDEYVDYLFSNVLPSKGNLKRNVSPSSIPYTFGAVYQSNQFYPGSLGNLEDPFIWRSARGMVLTVSPFQFNPSTFVLQYHKKMTFRIRYNESSAGLNEITDGAADPVMKKIQQRVFLNGSAEKYTILEEQGDMLVITTDALTDEIQPLVNWKNQKGIKTTVVTTTTTGTTDTEIKAYVTTALQNNPNLVYVLLVGDHADVPSHTYGNSGGEELWSDSYYGQITGGTTDFYPELFVGRFSGSSSDITTQVNRTLEYEKNPAAGDWMEKAIGLGSNEGDGIGDDGEPDWEHLRNIRSVLMNYGYSSVSEFYDGNHGGDDASGDPSSSIILPVVNSGVGLFNYTGHGAQNVCVTGNFSSTNVNQATNNGFYPFVISVACNNGTFTSGTCISEVWLSSTNNSAPAGAIAAAGSSILMNWAEPMQTQDEMAEIIAENYPSNKKETLGGLFYNSQCSMLETYPGSGGKEVMQTWVLFGDPSAVFRNKQTMPIVISHTQNVSDGATSILVNCDVDNSLIAVSQNNVLLGSAMSSGGNATINFPALTTNDPILVTVTKQNHITYQDHVQVGNGPVGLDENLDLFTVYPVPATDQLTVQTNASSLETIQIIDMNGVVVSSVKASANGTTTISVTGLSSGTYVMKLSGSGITSRKLVQIIK